MSSRSIIWICVSVGGFIGGYIPALWGDNFLSISSIIFSTIGGLSGIWAGFKLSQLI